MSRDNIILSGMRFLLCLYAFNRRKHKEIWRFWESICSEIYNVSVFLPG